MAIYMKINNIKGNVSTRGFEGAILVHSLDQQSSRSISQSPGMGQGREMGSLSFNHVRIIKEQDAASSALYQHFCTGQNINQVELFYCPVANNTADWRTKYTLHNVAISSHRELMSGDGGQEIMELAYTKIEKGYKQQDAKGNLHSPSFAGYDLTTATHA